MPDRPIDEDPPPVPPVWPDDDACCGNGCDPCIYDLFALQDERYRRALKEWEARHGPLPVERSQRI